MRRVRRTVGGIAALMATAVALSACQDAPAGADLPSSVPSATQATPVLDLRFDAGLVNDGELDAEIRELASGAGVTFVAAGTGGGRAIAFPDARQSRVVITVLDRQSTGLLDPGRRPFVLGADVRLDRLEAGDDLDNGENVVQRGLFDDGSQYKLQLDHGYPSCLVTGSTGRVFAKSKIQLAPGSWYRLECRRVRDDLTVVVRDLAADRTLDQVTASGPIGDVAVPATVPLTIGAKAGANGAFLASSTDQFDGALDNVLFAVD